MAELEVIVDGRPAQRGANIVIRSLDGIEKKANRLNKGLGRTDRQMRGVGRSASGLATGIKAVAGALAVREIAQYADTWTQVQNRLRLVTDGTEQLAGVTEELFQISQRSRNSFAATGELYSRVARSSEQLGLSTRELLGVTESVNQAIAISGVSAESANAALVQLGQGLASGALRGDELRSVLEQTPRLAQAIADGLDVPIGALRELGAEGELTADKVIKALQDQADVLENEFGQTVPTLGQAFDVLGNSITRAIGKFSDATGASSGFASIIIDIADFIAGDFTDSLLEFGDVLNITFSEAGDLFDSVGSEFGDLGETIGNVVGFILESVGDLPLNVVRLIKIAGVEVTGFFRELENDFKTFSNTIRGIVSTILGDEAGIEQAIQERLALQEQEKFNQIDLADARQRLLEEFKQQEDELTEKLKERQNAAEKANDALKDEGGEGGSKGPDTKSLKEAERLLASVQTEQEKFNEQIALANALNEKGALVGEEYNTVIQRLSEAYSQTLPEVEAYNDEIEENKKIVEELKSPQENFNDRIAKLDELLAAGALSWDAYGRGVREANAELIANDPILAKQAENLERANELLAEIATPQDEYNMKITELNELLAAGALDSEQYDRLKEAATTAFEEATIAADPFLSKLNDIAESAGQKIESAFVDFLVDPSKDAFDSMLMAFIETVQRMVAEAAALAIINTLLPGGGGVGGALSGLIMPRADGGPVSAGNPYLVGEEGPELIVPKSSGTVIPNGQTEGMMGGQQTTEVNVQPQITNVVDPQGMTAAIESTQGQQAILNVIQQNPTAIQRALQ